MNIEEFDKELNAITDAFVKEATNISQKFIKDVAELVEKSSDVPTYFQEASMKNVEYKIEKALNFMK